MSDNRGLRPPVDDDDESYPLDRGSRAAAHRKVIKHFTALGERIPPVAKPHRRKSCVWVHGVGWVWNPNRRPINMGEES